MADSGLLQAISDGAVRILRVGKGLVGVHLEMAQAEAARDVGRVATGALLVGVGLVCLSAATLALNAAAVVALERSLALGLPAAMGLVAAADVALGAGLVFAGRRRLTRPVMKETRTLMKRTVSVLREA